MTYLRPFVDKEGVGVENRADARVVQPGDDPPPGFPAVRPFLPVQLHVAEAEELAAAVVIDLGEAEAPRHLDPIGDVGFGEAPKLKR